MRVCHPGPLARKYSSTSGEIRNLTACFGRSPMGGRPRRNSFLPLYTSADRKNSLVNSGASSELADFLFPELLLFRVGVPHRHNMTSGAARRPHHHHKATVEESSSNKPRFTPFCRRASSVSRGGWKKFHRPARNPNLALGESWHVSLRSSRSPYINVPPKIKRGLDRRKDVPGALERFARHARSLPSPPAPVPRPRRTFSPRESSR